MLGALAGVAAAIASAQIHEDPMPPGVQSTDTHLPNGKLQRDEILRVEYEQNLKDAHELTQLAQSFEQELDKSDRYVLSLPLLKKLDDMEKLTRHIRSRMKR